MEKAIADAQVIAAQPALQSFRPLMTLPDVADYLRVSTRTVERLLEANEFPTPCRVGGSNRWHFATIDSWFAGRFADVNPSFFGDSSPQGVETDATVHDTQAPELAGSGAMEKPKGRGKRKKRDLVKFPHAVDSVRPQGKQS